MSWYMSKDLDQNLTYAMLQILALTVIIIYILEVLQVV